MAFTAKLTMPEAKAAMDKIATTLQKGEASSGGGMKCNEPIKAGSLGHGTAVPGHYDLDIVVCSEDVDGDKILQHGYEFWLNILEAFLDRKFPHQLTQKRRTTHSLQFTFNRDLPVDLLVSPLWKEPNHLYQFLQHPNTPPAKRQMFSSSASKWQKEFFRHQPEQAKEFIRRAKAWRDVMWEGGREGKPKSFLLSVLVLRAHEIAEKKMGDTSTKRMAMQTTAEVKKIVREHYHADIYWEEYYRTTSYPRLFPRSLPRIVDPANPSNNLHDTGICGPSNTKAHDYGEGGGSWDNFVRFVDSLDLTLTVEQILA